MTTKRSPLTDKPLRNPGQSLERQFDDLLLDKVFAPLLLILMLIWYAGMEWWRYFHPKPANPGITTIIVSLVVVYYAFRLWRT